MRDPYAFLLPIVHFTFGCTLLIVWRAGARSAAAWGIGFLLSSLGFAGPLLMALPVQGRAMVANLAFTAAFLAYGEALVTRFGLPRRMILRGAIAMLSIAGYSWAILGPWNLRLQLLSSDLGCALLILVCLPGVRGRLRRPIDRALVFVTLLVAVDVLMLTGTMFLTIPADDSVPFLSTTYAFLLQTTSTVLGLVQALVALAAVTLDRVAFYRTEAATDPLSGLLNRRGFDHAVKGRGQGAPLSGSIVIADIDYFKQVNDRCGHAAGDRAIVVLARLMGDRMPDDAIVARFGGEEFIAFLPGCGLGDALALADDVRRRFAETGAELAGVMLPMTASFGVADLAAGDLSLHDAIARADGGLYEAKAAGRDRVVACGLGAPDP
jgi:diguanylate cyclase (GGDEF)-like protein